ncbi:MAG: CinA family nicotinamide mononucleotide deamidase-related protein [Gammaproteobacteria bacterium]|nr:CinA family nicotinamide mononucleotide deamidase-related protein [Gammaproteobacteria bacterium]
MNVQLLLTGNELMRGDTVDSNSAMIAQHFGRLGIDVSRKVTVGDDLELLVSQLRELATTADILVVNGGLGPTIDDLTAEAAARLTDTALVEHPEAVDHLRRWCAARSFPLNPSNLKQSLLPEGASIIPNPRGSAVGFKVRFAECDIYCTPGVPVELRGMLEQTLIPDVSQRLDPDQIRLIQRFHTYGIGESSLQQWIVDEIPDRPPQVELGFRAGAPTLEVKLQSPACAATEHHRFVGRLGSLLKDYIVAESDGSLARTVVDTLKGRGLKMTTAESCTGGLIASMLTGQAGASAVFEAGFVTYANNMKEEMLGVSPEALISRGAVSETVVRQMALGALSRSGADCAVAVSGIAGPDGGTEEKPVGTVWLAWGSAADMRSVCLYFPYGRRMFQTMVAGAALDLVRRFIAGIESTPRYFRDRRLKSPAS